MSARSKPGFERRMSGECRVDLSDDRKIRGTAIVFNSESVDLGGFTEVILPEAVDRSLTADVRALVDHDSSKIMGRTLAGTLALRKTRAGLAVEIDPPETTYARDILASVGRGDVTGMSFGFRVLTDEWRMVDGLPLREILDMHVYEVSIVTFPAYPETDVTVAQRSIDKLRQEHGRLEYLSRVLRSKRAR